MSKEHHINISTNAEAAYVNEQLLAHNHAAIPYDPATYKHDLNFVIKDADGKPIAGVNSAVFAHYTLSVDILWIAPEHKGKGLGTSLLMHVENEAEALGAALSILYTYDFQAKDFYIKHGYEVFGQVDDCPLPGRFRYHMKKCLVPKS